MNTFPSRGLLERIDGGAFRAFDAVLTGDVSLAEDASVWFGCVLRGDDAPIVVGERTNVQDLSMIHADPGVPNIIGADVTIGHRAILHGALVGDRCLIGMGAILMSGTCVGEECLVAAGAVVLEGTEIPPRSMVAGVPARVVRSLTDEEVGGMLESAEHYVVQARAYVLPSGSSPG